MLEAWCCAGARYRTQGHASYPISILRDEGNYLFCNAIFEFSLFYYLQYSPSPFPPSNMKNQTHPDGGGAVQITYEPARCQNPELNGLLKTNTTINQQGGSELCGSRGGGKDSGSKGGEWGGFGQAFLGCDNYRIKNEANENNYPNYTPTNNKHNN